MNSIPIIRTEAFAKYPFVQSGMSTRLGGVSPAPLGMNLSFSVGDDEANVNANRELFFRELEVSLDELAISRQVHSANVRSVDAPGIYPNCDALITNAPRVFLCISVADCVPIVVLDPRKRVLAAIHAGWRGTAANIARQAVSKMVSEFSATPDEMIAYVGPSASVCCYSVGNDVAAQFSFRFVHVIDGKPFVDLKSANAAQLAEAGIPPGAIEISPLCTITESALLHSYRRDKERSGRMMCVTGLK